MFMLRKASSSRSRAENSAPRSELCWIWRGPASGRGGSAHRVRSGRLEPRGGLPLRHLGLCAVPPPQHGAAAVLFFCSVPGSLGGGLYSAHVRRGGGGDRGRPTPHEESARRRRLLRLPSAGSVCVSPPRGFKEKKKKEEGRVGGENKENPRDMWSPSLPARSQWHSGQPERPSVGGRLCRVNRRMVGKSQKATTPCLF